MQSRHSFISAQLDYFIAVLSTQIKLRTRSNHNDIAVDQEDSLLYLINEVYGTGFVNLNSSNTNFPSIDYGSTSMGIGLQMTATISKKKFSDTINAHRENNDLNKNYPKLWFFLLTAENKNNTYNENEHVKYITLLDFVNEVRRKPIEFQEYFLGELKKECSQYFQPPINRYALQRSIPVPNDIMLFNEHILTKDCFIDNPGEGYITVIDSIEDFIKKLQLCPITARQLLVAIIRLSDAPTDLLDEISIKEDDVLGSLNKNETNEGLYFRDRDFLKNNELLDVCEENVRLVYNSDHDIEYDIYYNLDFMLSEPEINLYSALYTFYRKWHSIDDLCHAIKNCDFSKLSDSACINNTKPQF